MQTFSPALMLAAAGMDTPPEGAPGLRELTQSLGIGPMIAVVVGLQVLTIVGYWLTSFVIVRERATFGRAATTWISMIGLSIALSVMAAIITVFVVRSAAENQLWWLALPALGIIAIAGFISVPMKIYEIGAGRSFLFLLLSSAIFVAANIGLELIFIGSVGLGKTVLLDQFRTKIVEAKPSGPDQEAVRAEIAAQQAELARKYELLEIRRRHMPPGDSEARAAYERDKADYERELAALKERAASLQY